MSSGSCQGNYKLSLTVRQGFWYKCQVVMSFGLSVSYEIWSKSSGLSGQLLWAKCQTRALIRVSYELLFKGQF